MMRCERAAAAKAFKCATCAACAEALGDLPRRASLGPGGRLAERCAPRLEGDARAPLAPEVEQLSRVCEALRAAAGRPVWPRATRDLLRLCVSGPAFHGAWQALYADCLTGDVDEGAAAEAWARDPAALADAVAGAREADTLAAMGGCLARLLPRCSPATLAALGERLAVRLPALVDLLARHARTVQRELRDALLVSLGRALAAAALDAATVAGLVRGALERHQDAVARLFLQLDLEAAARQSEPPGQFEPPGQSEPAGLFELALERARAVHVDDRYPLLALLARLAPAGVPPACAAPLRELALGTLAAECARQRCDARQALACAALVLAAQSGEAALAGDASLAGEAALAGALQCVCAAAAANEQKETCI